MTGAINGYIDVAQLVLYAFWIFFACLIVYIRREDRREGYPLESDTSPGKLLAPSIFFYPPPKSFRLSNGSTVQAPTGKPDGRVLAAAPVAPWPGAPLRPTGPNPMLDSIGPGAWAERADVPELTIDGHLKIVPVRVATGYAPSSEGPDPRGYTVIGADGKAAGAIADIWVDRSEHLIRYYEIELGGPTPRRVLLPNTFCVIRPNARRVEVEALLARQFADVPATRAPDQVTRLEEERICAYYGAGTLYATPGRQEPLI